MDSDSVADHCIRIPYTDGSGVLPFPPEYEQCTSIIPLKLEKHMIFVTGCINPNEFFGYYLEIINFYRSKKIPVYVIIFYFHIIWTYELIALLFLCVLLNYFLAEMKMQHTVVCCTSNIHEKFCSFFSKQNIPHNKTMSKATLCLYVFNSLI